MGPYCPTTTITAVAATTQRDNERFPISNQRSKNETKPLFLFVCFVIHVPISHFHNTNTLLLSLGSRTIPVINIFFQFCFGFGRSRNVQPKNFVIGATNVAWVWVLVRTRKLFYENRLENLWKLAMKWKVAMEMAPLKVKAKGKYRWNDQKI